MHTQGEWIAEHIGNEGKYGIHTGDLFLSFAHTFPNRFRSPQVSSEEAEANAHLIASSPLLYEALKMAYSWYYQGTVDGDYRLLGSQMKEALSKADGK